MKKFVFSLQTLYDHTLDRKDEQEKVLVQLEKHLQDLHVRIRLLSDETTEHRRTFQEVTAAGCGAGKVQQFSMQFASLREQQLHLEVQVIEQEKVIQTCRQYLIQLMKEIQALENLQEKQLHEYKLEMNREMDKEMDEFISFRNGNPKTARGLA